LCISSCLPTFRDIIIFLRMGPICCPETSVNTCQPTARNASKERRFQAHRCGSPKSHRLTIAACLQRGHNLLSLQGILSYTLLRRLLCIVVTATVIRGLIFKDATRCDYPAVSEHVTNYSAETGLMAGLCTLVVDAMRSFGGFKCTSNTEDMMRSVAAVRDSE